MNKPLIGIFVNTVLQSSVLPLQPRSILSNGLWHQGKGLARNTVGTFQAHIHHAQHHGLNTILLS